MSELEFSLKAVTKSYGSLRVLAGLSMEVARNHIVAVLGPSGCGKTTLLSLIAGLIPPDSGAMEGLRDKDFSYLFQDPRLLDWLTVRQNIAFVLKDRIPANQVGPVVESSLARVGLADQGGAYPRRLSGGQRQRVSMARALSFPSRVLLMDEPFKSLDLGLRLDLIGKFLAGWAAAPRTVVCVTHDVKEALLLADQVYVLTAKPTIVRRQYTVEIPRNLRRLDDGRLLSLEQEVTADLLG